MVKTLPDTRFRFLRFVLTILLAALPVSTVIAQMEAERMGVSLRAGTSKYYGEFTDDLFGPSGDLQLSYTPTRFLTFGIGASVSWLNYRVTPDRIAAYPEYFGPGAAIGDYYPGTTVTITDKNAMRATTYELTMLVNLLPGEKLVPFIGGGAGFLLWAPVNTNEHADLPNVRKEIYDRITGQFPVIGGLHLYVTDDLALTATGAYRFTLTHYLDDVKGRDPTYDHFATITLGITYNILGDSDWDSDGLTNDEERRLGTDPRNPDTDGDGLNDFLEVKVYLSNPFKADTDGDNLTDFEEVYTYNSSPIKKDSDGDGLDDGEEAARGTNPRLPDSDADGIGDFEEVYVYLTDPTREDTDNDGLTDAQEIRRYGTSPLLEDTDGDGLTDGEEVLVYGTNPLLGDSDGDCLSDYAEVKIHHTDPLNVDTDGDRLFDGEEIMRFKTDPLNPDTDSDGLSDADELSCRYQTNPLNPDTDGDGIIDSMDPTPSAQCCGNCGGIPPYASTPGLDCGCKDGINKNQPQPGTSPVPQTPSPTGSPSKGRFSKDIRFRHNSDEFDFSQSETSTNLGELLEYMQQNCDNLQVVIEGHASSEGNPRNNQVLSERRAAKVMQWLLERGVDPQRVRGTLGYGSTMPRVSESGGNKLSKSELEARRAQNRRIEVNILRDCEG